MSLDNLYELALSFYQSHDMWAFIKVYVSMPLMILWMLWAALRRRDSTCGRLMR